MATFRIFLGNVSGAVLYQLHAPVISRRNVLPRLNFSFEAPFNPNLVTVVAGDPFYQTDWPNPRGPAPRQYWTDSFKLPLQQTQPPHLTDWPNPNLRTVQRQDWIFPQPYTLNVVAAAPFVQTDWPNPRSLGPRRDWSDSFKLPLQQVIQPNQYDWPNPVLRTVRRQDWSDSFKLPLQQVIQGNQYNWPNPPLAAKRNPQDWQLSTPLSLSSAVQPPFFETEWPNPVLRTVQRQGWTDSFKLPIQQNLPENQYNWPNPVLRTVQRPDWRDSFKLPLQGVIQPNQYSWPNPTLRAVQRMDWIFPQPYVLNVVAEVVNPGFNEWAVPDAIRRLRQDWIFPQPYVLSSVVGTPFVQTEWPNPKGPAPRQTSFTDSFKLPLQQTIQPNQYNWPNPRGPQRGPQDWLQATSIALSTAVAPPFIQVDWPNPVLRTVQRRDWSDSFKLPLQQTLPPRQTDWPVPAGARRARLDWQSYGLPETQVPPNNQTEWPNPVRAKVRVQDWIAASSVALTSVITLPFTQLDWPNPSRRKVSLLPTWTDAFKLPLQQRLPPRQLDWPNPRGPRQPVITARDFIAGIRPEPPIPPVYDADNTLKNEIRRMRYLDNATGRTRFLKNEVRR